MSSFFKHVLQRQLAKAARPQLRLAERQLLLQCQTAAHDHRKLSSLHGLHTVEFSGFSQWDEDGIIDWLAERLPGIEPSFVEFGVEDYRESNTRLLLQLRNWRGLVLDGSAENVASIRRQNIYWRHQIEAVQAFIDCDNINRLIEEGGMAGEIGLLSVDIDGNDYWVWKAISFANPAIVVCEYNAVLGDLHALTVPYRSDFQRGRAHHSNLYFGASLRALRSLAAEKGYSFVGTTSSGCNAFFVRDDLAGNVLSALEGVWAFPSVFREARDEEGRKLFTGGVDRMRLIADMPLIDVETGAETSLAACGEIYSPEWRASKPVRMG